MRERERQMEGKKERLVCFLFLTTIKDSMFPLQAKFGINYV